MKSMPAFFVDNLPMLVHGAELFGNLVLAACEPAKYPTYVTIGMASAEGFDGIAIVQAGNLGVVATIFEGFTRNDLPAVREILAKKPATWPATVHQYKVDVTALIQAILLRHVGELGKPDLSTKPGSGPSTIYAVLRLLTALGDNAERRVLCEALRRFLDDPSVEGVTKEDAFGAADGMLNTITMGD